MAAVDVYRALWRYKFVILALTAACVAAAWYATSRQERTYEASTLVRVQQRGADGDTFAALQASERLAQTYAKIIDSGALKRRIGPHVTGKMSPAEALSVQLSGKPVEGLGLLWISARSESPITAARVANAAPLALTDFAEVGKLRDQIVTVKPASVPSSPAAPNTSLNISLAFLLALVFNSALVLLFEMLRDRLPDHDELGPELGYSVLATIPTLRLRRMRDLEAGLEETAVTISPSPEGAPTLGGAEGGRTRWS